MRQVQPQRAIAIVQSNYIPWRGYFDLIAAVDEFVLLDEAQYTRRDWRNRNKVKTPQGWCWLTIPVATRGRYHQRISETRVTDPRWGRKHWKTIGACYRGATFFERYRPRLEALFLDDSEIFLSRINRRFLEAMCEILRIDTPLRNSAEFDFRADVGRSERLVDICRQAGATDYLSGPAARSYLDTELFAAAGIDIHWADYSGYREYRQLYPPFEPALSVLDLILNEGPGARGLLKTPEDG